MQALRDERSHDGGVAVAPSAPAMERERHSPPLARPAGAPTGRSPARKLVRDFPGALNNKTTSSWYQQPHVKNGFFANAEVCRMLSHFAAPGGPLSALGAPLPRPPEPFGRSAGGRLEREEFQAPGTMGVGARESPAKRPI